MARAGGRPYGPSAMEGISQTAGGTWFALASAARASRWDAPARRALRHTLIITGVAMVVLVFAIVGPQSGTFGFDAHSYWGFPRPELYEGTTNASGIAVYRYAPAFVPVLEVFTLLPKGLFLVLWGCLLAGCYLALTGRKWGLVLAFPPVLFELYMGNIHLLMAAAVVVGFRHPAAWAFILLTKVTPGVGILWFAVRREWRSLAIAVGVSAAIVGIGLVVSPDAWLTWFRTFLTTRPADGPNRVTDIALPIRLVAAALLVAWGARTDRRWTVLVAATIALPTVWDHGLAMLVGLVRLVGRDAGSDRGASRDRSGSSTSD
jgi:hypothetical protein